MTPKTEAVSLGEQIKQALYTSNGRHACDHPSQYAATADCEKLIDRLVALATSEPRLTPVGAGDGNTYVVSERPVVRVAIPQAVGERLPLTDERIATAWKVWPRTAITSAERAIEFIRFAEKLVAEEKSARLAALSNGKA